MATAPQHILDLLNSLIQAYPTGLPEGIHLNLNLDIKLDTSGDGSDPTDALDDPADAPAEPVYKGPFLGLYRVIANTEAHRIKIRSDCDSSAPEASIRLETRHLNYMRALNPTKPTYLESNGYIYQSSGSASNTFYRQYAFGGQLVVVAETKKAGNVMMGRIVGIGTDPLNADPKPLDTARTNNNLTPWLVHQIPGVLIFAPIFFSGVESGWVSMNELEKIR